MSSLSNDKRRHTRLNIELSAVLGFEGGGEYKVRTDNLSFSGARFSLSVSCSLPPPVLNETADDDSVARTPTDAPDIGLIAVDGIDSRDGAREATSDNHQVQGPPHPGCGSNQPSVQLVNPPVTSESSVIESAQEPLGSELPSGVSMAMEAEPLDSARNEPAVTSAADATQSEEQPLNGVTIGCDSSEDGGHENLGADPEEAPSGPTRVVVIPDDILEWVDLTLPGNQEPIRLSVREIRRTDDALMVEFVDSTFTEYSLYKQFLIQRGLESGSDLTGEFDANPHLAENFELEFNNRKLGQILEILYGLTSREVKTAIAEQRQSGRRLGDILISWGRITKQQLQAAIAVSKSGQDTLFSQFFLKVLPNDIWQRFWQLLGEGASIVLVTLGVMVGLGGIPQGGLISIFLVATALTSRIESILQHQSDRQRGREVLGLFLGLFVGYGLASLLFNSGMIYRMFEVLLNSNGVTNTETLFDRKFHSILPIMANNLMVLISGCILSFCFRQYGVLLTLVWNACLWGVSLVTLVTQTLDRIQSDLALKVVASTFSLMPHLAIEALGYIYAASAAHGISKAVMWGKGARAQQRRAITTYLGQIVIGALLIIAGAFLESYWVPWSMRAIMLD